MRHVAIVFFLGLCAISCGDDSVSGNLEQRDEKALAEWRRNEAIIEKALEGPSNPDELLNSAIFFQELTGIMVRGDMTTFGYMPNSKTRDDLEKLRQWYREHRDSLYWDKGSKSVKLR